MSLPQLNTVCQYLGHRGLIVEIWHTHTQTHKHTLYKHRKVLTPNSNLELQTITGLAVTKPKMKKGGHAVGCLGLVVVVVAAAEAGCLALTVEKQNVFHDADEFHSVC